jgi:hypothetical protein
MTAMTRVADAQESLRLQFSEHKRQRLDESDNAIFAEASAAPRSIREGSKLPTTEIGLK